MEHYKKRNRSDSAVNTQKKNASMHETDLVLKLKKEELFNQHILLPHAELNSIVYNNVDTFVEKYKGDGMSLSICTDSVNPIIQNLFREVYRSHYEDELNKINRYLKRHYGRAAVLLIVSIAAFVISRQLTKIYPSETIMSYLIGNISCFCLWEVGYTQFATRDVANEKKRVTRALNAEISFQ